MELKNALTICLISLFSATLVVLIARSLDSQAAARLEPQLERIATQLEALRSAGGIASTAPAGTPAATPRDGLVVYYFHGHKRCPTCRAIEAQAYDAIVTDFADPVDRGALLWQTLNYDESSGKELAKTFEVQAAVVVLARMKDGQLAEWKRLDEVWGLVGNKPAFAEFMRNEVNRMLPPPMAPESVPAQEADISDIPVPDEADAEMPAPTDPSTVPIPD